MKRLYAVYGIVMLFMLSMKAEGQNMVPNGNFEAYSTCPGDVDQMARCAGWRRFHGGTSDYYNTCAPVAQKVNVPNNILGYQQAANGNAYAGVQTYNGVPDYKEYIARAITPLTPGTLYEVSLSVNLTDTSAYATNDLGVWFYHTGPTSSIPGNNVLNITPQVSFINYGVITDTAKWVRVTATFVADSAYDNMVIGGFGKNIPILAVGKASAVSPYAYYYIDSIVVRPTNIGFNLADTAFCAGQTLTLPFSAYSPKYSASNVFMLQLSDAAGSFANPVTIATQTGNSSSGVFTWVVPASITPGYGYRIRIKTTDAADSSYISRTITIGNVLPERPLAWNNVPVCENDTLKLNVSDATPGVTYKWSGPAGFLSNAQYAVRVPALATYAGQYIVGAWLYGCVRRDTLPVNIVPTVGVIGISSSGIACATDTLKLLGTSTLPGTTYKWTGPNGYLSYAKDTLIPHPDAVLAGNYVLTGYYQGCSSTYNVGISILPAPANVVAILNTPLCDGDTLKLGVTSSSAGVLYKWTGPKGFTSNAQQPSIRKISETQNGLYIVTATLYGCVVADTLVVNVVPKQHVMITASNAPVCTGDTLKLFGNSIVPSITGYSWKGPNGFTSSAQHPVIISPDFSATGKYILTGYFAGCPSTDTILVGVKPLPANVTASTNAPVCEGDTLLLQGNSTSTGSTYHWQGPGGFTTAAKDIPFLYAQPNSSGDYVLTASLNGCKASATTTVLVKPKPLVPQLSSNSPLRVGDTLRLNVDNAEANVSYTWAGPLSFNSSLAAPAIDSVTKEHTGTYTILASRDGCTSGSLIVITIGDRPDTSIFVVYPNYSNGNFNIRATTIRDQQVPINITAANGQEVYSTSVRTEKKELKAYISLKDTISDGIYTLRLIIDGHMHSVQLLVKR